MQTHRRITGLALFGVLAFAAGCSESPSSPMDNTEAEATVADMALVTGFTAEQLAALPAPSPVLAPRFEASLGSTVLDFEDLEAGQHQMGPHNPYHGVTFSYQGFCPSVYHWDNVGYGLPVSGTKFLFNGCGYDNESMTLDSPQTFQGAWVANPHYDNPQFHFDMYLGGVLVASSATITLQKDMVWLPSGYNGPVDHIVMRIANGYWWVMDDVTFKSDPADKDECKKGGWEDFGFKNQGQCVRFIETGKDSR